MTWKEVQQKIAQLIRDKIIVGYALWDSLRGEPFQIYHASARHSRDLSGSDQSSASATPLWLRGMLPYISHSATRCTTTRGATTKTSACTL